jgi:hypothetical protein
MFFSKKPSSKIIQDKVCNEISSLQGVGLPRDPSFEKAFTDMVDRLESWATSENLGDWKRSTIMGVLEPYLKIDCKHVMSPQQADYYVKYARKIILRLK